MHSLVRRDGLGDVSFRVIHEANLFSHEMVRLRRGLSDIDKRQTHLVYPRCHDLCQVHVSGILHTTQRNNKALRDIIPNSSRLKRNKRTGCNDAHRSLVVTEPNACLSR